MEDGRALTRMLHTPHSGGLHSGTLGVCTLRVYTLGVYTLGVYTLVQRILDLEEHLPTCPTLHTLGVYTLALGVYTLRVLTLDQWVLDLEEHSLACSTIWRYTNTHTHTHTHTRMPWGCSGDAPGMLQGIPRASLEHPRRIPGASPEHPQGANPPMLGVTSSGGLGNLPRDALGMLWGCSMDAP
jgi:hypothetical protein